MYMYVCVCVCVCVHVCVCECACVCVCCTLKGHVQKKIWTQMGFETQALLIITHMLYHYSMYNYIHVYIIILLYLY